jgi:hypothetical protein
MGFFRKLLSATAAQDAIRTAGMGHGLLQHCFRFHLHQNHQHSCCCQRRLGADDTAELYHASSFAVNGRTARR